MLLLTVNYAGNEMDLAAITTIITIEQTVETTT